MGALIDVDDSEFPLVLVTFPIRLTALAVDKYMEVMTAVAARGRFALVGDIRRLSVRGLSFDVRQRFFEKAKVWDAGPGYKRKISEAIVVDGWFTRALLAAYIWQVQRPDIPMRVMTSLEEARAWSLENLAANHVPESA